MKVAMRSGGRQVTCILGAAALGVEISKVVD
jgi:hypothetical protein